MPGLDGSIIYLHLSQCYIQVTLLQRNENRLLAYTGYLVRRSLRLCKI